MLSFCALFSVKKKECEKLNDPPNGKVEVDGLKKGSTAIYTCDKNKKGAE